MLKKYGKTALYILWWVILFIRLFLLNMPKISLVSSAVGVKSNIAHILSRTRLPYAEGGRPPTTQTTHLTLGEVILALNAANREVIPEGLEITTSTLKLEI